MFSKAVKSSFISKDKLDGDFSWITRFNGGRIFRVVATVFSDRPKIFIYRIRDGKLMKTIDNFIGFWVGVSIKNKMTEFSGGVGKWTRGNTFLIKISKNEYIFVGHVMASFSSDEILWYVSPIGNNEVPYPIAFTKSTAIFPIDGYELTVDDLKINEKSVDTFNDVFYGHDDNKYKETRYKLKKYKKVKAA